MMACVAIRAFPVFMWTLFGYSLAFGSDHGGVIEAWNGWGLTGSDGMQAPIQTASRIWYTVRFR